jgi:hypothetical protein
MSKNIILKTINEVRFFKHQILSAVASKDYKKTFLILSKQPILNIEALKNYLIENDLNTFAKKEITTLIHLIDAYFQLENSYKELPSEDCNFNYKYENKGAGFGGGGVIFFLEVKGNFLRTDNETFDEKEPLFSYLSNFNFIRLTNRLKEINELFETQPKEYDYLGEYLKSLSIEPAFFCITNYKQNDYDNFVLRLKHNETKYFKTFDLLESYDDKLQIKCNYIESLKIYKSKLSMLAFKEKVSDLIKLVEDCFKSYKNNISNNDNSLSENPYLGTPTNDKLDNYKNTIWFKTGIKLATGEAYELYNKYKKDKGHFTKICLELGFKKTNRPYFSETINDNSTDKNTFADNNKLQKLHDHLRENNLKFGAVFLAKYNQIEL